MYIRIYIYIIYVYVQTLYIYIYIHTHIYIHRLFYMCIYSYMGRYTLFTYSSLIHALLYRWEAHAKLAVQAL